jgi:hypothetical protein
LASANETSSAISPEDWVPDDAVSKTSASGTRTPTGPFGEADAEVPDGLVAGLAADPEFASPADPDPPGDDAADGVPVNVVSGDPGAPVCTTMTWSPGPTPPEGSWPSLSARPTTASPAGTGGSDETSAGASSEPFVTVTAATLPSTEDARADGMVATPDPTSTDV